MRPNVLIAMPYKPTLAQALVDKMLHNVEAALVSNPKLDIEVGYFTGKIEKQEGDRVWGPVGRARDKTIELHLRDHHTHVFWVDADIVEWPADLPTTLYEANPTGIAAPFVLIEGRPNHFYDTAAYFDWGMRALRAGAPWWWHEHGGQPVEMLGVGCCYLTPAWPYREGVKHEDTPWTDHWRVCEAVRLRGEKVLCLPELFVWHADLPKWGENWH